MFKRPDTAERQQLGGAGKRVLACREGAVVAGGGSDGGDVMSHLLGDPGVGVNSSFVVAASRCLSGLGLYSMSLRVEALTGRLGYRNRTDAKSSGSVRKIEILFLSMK